MYLPHARCISKYLHFFHVLYFRLQVVVQFFHFIHVRFHIVELAVHRHQKRHNSFQGDATLFRRLQDLLFLNSLFNVCGCNQYSVNLVPVSSVNNLSLSLSKLSLRIKRLRKVLSRMSVTPICDYIVTEACSYTTADKLSFAVTLNPLVTRVIGMRQVFFISTAVITWSNKKTTQL